MKYYDIVCVQEAPGTSPFPLVGEGKRLTGVRIINKKGEEITCDVLFTFTCEDKHYVVYTDRTYNFRGKLNVKALAVSETGTLLLVEDKKLLRQIRSAHEMLLLRESHTEDG